MNLKKLGLAGMMACALALPAAAQTMQTSPQTPTTSIPTRPGVTSGLGGARTTGAPVRMAPVNINSASASDLDKLPGIGKVRADAIIKNRPYRSPEDLQSRHIVPPNVYNKIKNQVVTGPG